MRKVPSPPVVTTMSAHRTTSYGPRLHPRRLQLPRHLQLQRLVDVVMVADGGVVAAASRQLLLELLLAELLVLDPLPLELVARHLGEDDGAPRLKLAGVPVAVGGGRQGARQPRRHWD